METDAGEQIIKTTIKVSEPYIYTVHVFNNIMFFDHLLYTYKHMMMVCLFSISFLNFPVKVWKPITQIHKHVPLVGLKIERWLQNILDQLWKVVCLPN
jgi:hypothetical protein